MSGNYSQSFGATDMGFLAKPPQIILFKQELEMISTFNFNRTLQSEKQPLVAKNKGKIMFVRQLLLEIWRYGHAVAFKISTNYLVVKILKMILKFYLSQMIRPKSRHQSGKLRTKSRGSNIPPRILGVETSKKN